MKKILLVATVSRHFYLFEELNIKLLNELGYEVHCAANFDDVHERHNALKIIRHHLPFSRAPLAMGNYKAFALLKKMLAHNNFEVVHCHSPIAGAIARLAAAIYTVPVVYTAHGFHFYKGGPKSGWLLYYPIEYLMSHLTTVLITINDEDFKLASARFKSRRVLQIKGVGVKTKAIADFAVTELAAQKRMQLRRQLGASDQACVLISVGELNANKNHKLILMALARLKQRGIRPLYWIVGQGGQKHQLETTISELGLASQVQLFGFRNDVSNLLLAADGFVFPSLREGLSVALMEAMATGLPVICSDIRGNRDLVKPGSGGWLAASNSIDSFESALAQFYEAWQMERVAEMGVFNRGVAMGYDTQAVETVMRTVYTLEETRSTS